MPTCAASVPAFRRDKLPACPATRSIKPSHFTRKVKWDIAGKPAVWETKARLRTSGKHILTTMSSVMANAAGLRRTVEPVTG